MTRPSKKACGRDTPFAFSHVFIEVTSCRARETRRSALSPRQQIQKSITRRRASQRDTLSGFPSDHRPKTLASPRRNFFIFKHMHSCKNWNLLCIQSVNADPTHGSLKEPCSSDHGQNKKSTVWHQPESALLRHHQLFLSHQSPEQHQLDAPMPQAIRNQNPKLWPKNTCVFHFSIFCHLLSMVVQDTISRNDHFGHR